mgnify:CR=1 FL=1
MWDKLTDISVVESIQDGDTVMVGGFGVPGTPFTLLEALADHGAKDLTIIKNDANEQDMGIDWLLNNGQVKKLIVSHIGLNRQAVKLMNEGAIKVEFVPQGILAERIRAAGAGLLGVMTDIGIGTDYVNNKQVMNIDGQEAVFEPAIQADFALVHGAQGDHMGNLAYVGTAQNFNPLMAMAAKVTIAEIEQLVEAGDLAPSSIHTPSPFVDKVYVMPSITEVYDVVKR